MYIKRSNIVSIFLLFIFVLSISILTANYNKTNEKLNLFFSGIYPQSSIDRDENIFFKLNIDFKINKQIQSNENLFQTSNYNDGLRMEFGEKDAYLLFSDDHKKLFGIKVIDSIQIDTLYSLNLIYSRHTLRIEINGNTIYNDFTNVYPQFDSIKFGVGFDENRIFKSGKIINSDSKLIALSNHDFSFYILMLLIIFTLIDIKYIINYKKLHILNLTENYTYNKNIYNGLLFLRTIAWGMVFVIHGYIIFYNSKVSENLSKIIFYGFDLTFIKYPSAWGGVWIFFVLSGFLMGKGFISKRYNYYSDGILAFYTNRVLQIFPVYFFCVFVLAIFVHPEIFLLENLNSLIRILTFTNDGLLNVNLNGALWSLSTEIQFYIIVPFLVYFIVFLSKKIGLSKTLVLIIIFGFLERLLLYKISNSNTVDFEFWDRCIYKPLYANLDLFLIGILANLYIDYFSKNYNIRYALFLIVFFVVILLFTNFIFGYYTFGNFDKKYAELFVYALPTFTAFVTFILVILIECRDVSLGIKASKNILHYLGILTFVIYVWHEPILFKVNDIFKFNNTELKLLAGLLFCLFYGFLSYIFIEKPVGKYKKKL